MFNQCFVYKSSNFSALKLLITSFSTFTFARVSLKGKPLPAKKLPEIEPSTRNTNDHVRAPGLPTYCCLEQMRVAVACPS